MKRITYLFGVFAVLFAASTSCNKETDLGRNKKVITHIATITLDKAGSARTAVVEGESSASYIWNDDDAQYFRVTENGVAGTVTGLSLSQDKKTATLTVAFEGTPTAPYTYEAQYASGFSNSHNPKHPAVQSPLASTFDPAADVLVSRVITSADERRSELSFTMGRIVTVNKMTLTGLQAGEVISKVELTLDKVINGSSSITIDGDTGSFKYGGTKVLTLNYDSTTGVVPANGEFPVYFTAAPVDAAGIVSVVVNTDKNVYEKKSSLDPNPFSGKTLTLAIGTMKRFTMALSGYGEPISAGTNYSLVESQDDLVSGATYIIVGNNSSLVAMSSQNNNNRAKVDVSADNGVITINNSIEAATFTIESVSGGYTIKDNASELYLYAAGGNSNNYLRSTNTPGDTGTWSIEIAEGVASIVTTGANRGTMCYNASNSIFACYASLGSYKTLSLYIDPKSAVPDERDEVTITFDSSSINLTVDDLDFTNDVSVNPGEDEIVNALEWSYTNDDGVIDELLSSKESVVLSGNTGTAIVHVEFPGNDNYKPASASYTITVTAAPGHGTTADDPYTVAEAKAAIDANIGITGVYVIGIVSEIVTEYSSQYHNISFNISADGTTSGDQIEAYRCKNLNNTNFTSADDVQVGDEVVVYGNLKLYNTTYEFDAGCYLVSRKTAPYFKATLSSDSIAAEGGDITLTISSNTSWTVAVTGSATLSSNSGSNDGSITVTVPQNNEGAIYTLSFTATGVTPAPSDLTITQDAYVNLVDATAVFTSKTSGGMAAASNNATSGTRRNVTAAISSGGKNTEHDYIQVYKNANLVLSVPEGAYITGIEFTGVQGNPVSGFGDVAGLTINGNNGSWSGNTHSVSFTASNAQVRLQRIEVTYKIAAESLVNDPPVISVTSDNPMSIANTAGTKTIAYEILDAPDGAVLTGVTKSSGASWISNIVYTTSGIVSFDVAAQDEDADARTATLTLSYTGAADVPVTVDQAEGPSSEGTQDYTTVWTATSGALGSGIGSGTINTTTSGTSETQSWSYTRTLSSGTSYTGWSSNCIQLGKNGGVENLTLTTSNIPGTIKSVSVECASYQGKHNVAITVGETTYLASTATSSWTTVSAKTGTGSSSGTIVISFTGGSRALYIKSITVVYNN